ncbi:trehalose-phosphatase [Salinadaptatus halalkaliphilus]|uniref:Trehalose 6-phosphate phosphatase n=1 Tax=Salinadaptatus halalkaliphilus TaxID=2419781 RepID=A0A4S3TRA2_9EURY|nr:trehalose-phosphatase [Salinadaptatus halalkaliphilus]THE66180.1 trehalose-phosphatase [Salinadaptatus halalkaliphilus]
MATDVSPRPLVDSYDDVRARLAGSRRLLCCLDFDGTLAPIVEDPDEATALPATERALASLVADSRVTTAIVSGRALADVRRRIAGPRLYAGNHGLELARDESIAVHPVARKRAKRLGVVCSVLETVLDPVPNIRIENKRLTGTVHVRTVPAEARPLVTRLTRRTVDRVGEGTLSVSTGKRVIEIGPSIPWGKGNAVALLEADQPPGTTTLYIGDDVTDESAFRAIAPDGIGIRVGQASPSAAAYRVSSPADVATFLEWLDSTGLDALEQI